MPIKTFATQAEVPDAIRADAIETKDGKWIVSEDADTSDLEAQLATEKEKRDAAERLSRKTAGELQKLQNKKKADDAGMTEEKLKELRDDVRAEVLAELEPQLKDAEKVKATNRALTLDADMKARALKGGILPTKIDDFWTLRGGEFDLTDDGKPMVKGKPGVDPDKHLATLLKKNPEWVQGTKATGGGAGGTSTGAATTGITEADLQHPERLIEAGNKAAA